MFSAEKWQALNNLRGWLILSLPFLLLTIVTVHALVMLLMTTEVFFVTSARSPRVLASKRSKVVELIATCPFKESNALVRRRASEVNGFETRC